MMLIATTTCAEEPLRAVAPSQLCVTLGDVHPLSGNRVAILAPKVRAVMTSPTRAHAELRFTYVGPSAEEARLGSGELRRQIGIKLRAQDSCNVVYAMWRLEPEQKIVVSIKQNSGMRTHAECGTRGYTNVKARRSSPAPAVKPGEAHVLAAHLDSGELRITADGKVVWEGAVDVAFDGPVGLRTDNARFELELATGAPAGGQPLAHVPSRCVAGENE
jgi:hypothetical protein